MIATVVFGFRQRNEIIVVPIGTVFTFTQLRSSMPGAPEGFRTLFLFFNMDSAQTVAHQVDIIGISSPYYTHQRIYLLSGQIWLGYYLVLSFFRFQWVYRVTLI